MEKKWLLGTIREIDDLPDGVKAAVAFDTDEDHALCILIQDKNDEVFSCHFAIGWADEKKTNWIANVVGHLLRDAYYQGKRDSKKETSVALTGLKGLLEGIDECF